MPPEHFPLQNKEKCVCQGEIREISYIFKSSTGVLRQVHNFVQVFAQLCTGSFILAARYIDKLCLV